MHIAEDCLLFAHTWTQTSMSDTVPCQLCQPTPSAHSAQPHRRSLHRIKTGNSSGISSAERYS